MPNCWTIGTLLIFLLGSLCLWNCMRRSDIEDMSKWYGCIDQDGKPTDFYVIYKLPENNTDVDVKIKNGVAYMYLTPDESSRLQGGGVSSVLSYSDSASNWVLSHVGIDSSDSMPALTLNRFFADTQLKENGAYIFYNDEFPNGTTSFTHGHSKGVVMLTEHGGFWLVHSVPKYPSLDSGRYTYPRSGHKYGQSMLCISLPPLSTDLADSLGGQLLMNDVNIYNSNVPAKFSSNYKILVDIINGHDPHTPPYMQFREIASENGKTFTSFAKYKKFDNDLYDDYVAPMLKSSLLVESWRNGAEPLPSNCSAYFKVENIESIYTLAAGMEFSTHHDHSKWAIAQDSSRPYVCIGDINRMRTQFHRGGGTVCFWSLSVWHRFRDLVHSTETCPRDKFDGGGNTFVLFE